MRYIKKYEEHIVNEEFLGSLINAFKNLFSKATEEIKKLGENPSMDDLQTWLEENSFNKNSPNFLFKSEIDAFNKNPGADVEKCLGLITDILNTIGDDNMNAFYSSLLKVFGKNLAPTETIKYYFKTARNKFIKDFKFLGVDPATGKIDVAKINTDVTKDTSHLPELKAKLKPIATDEVKCKKATLEWVNGTVVPRLLKYVQDIKPADVEAYLKTKNIEAVKTDTDLKVGDIVTWKSKQGEDVRKPILKIEEDTLTFEDKEGKEFTKLKSEVVKVKEDGEVKPEDLTNTLKDMKAKKPENIAKVSNFAKFLSDEANAEKVAEIEKIINPTQNT